MRTFLGKIENNDMNREKCLEDLNKFVKKICAVSGATAMSAPEEMFNHPLHKDIACMKFDFGRNNWSHRVSISLYSDDADCLAYSISAEIYFGAIDLIGYSGTMSAEGLFTDIDVAIAKVSHLFKKEATFNQLKKEYNVIDDELARCFFYRNKDKTEILSQQKQNVLKKIRSLLI